MEVLVVYGREHPEGAVPSGAVVEGFQIFEECSGQLDPGAPLLPVEQFGLQSAPERLDDRVVVRIANGPHGWRQARLAYTLSEAPTGELGAVVGVDHRAGCWRSIGQRHGQGVGDERGGLVGVDRPATTLLEWASSTTQQ